MRTFWKDARKNKAFLLFLALALLLLVFSALAEWIVPHDPYETDFDLLLCAPSREHICGTDGVGRCLFCRILAGAKYSLIATFAMVLLTTMIGTTLGMTSGFFGGVVDAVIMRVTDILLSIPVQVFCIAMIAMMRPGLGTVIIAISLLWWTKYARMTRNEVMKIRKAEYVEEAVLGGESNFRILFRYMLPNILPQIVVMSALDVGRMMLAIAGYSYLGLSAQPPTPEWGYMLSEGKRYIQTSPWMMLYPGVAIFVTVVLFNLLGDSLRDVLDPKSKSRIKNL